MRCWWLDSVVAQSHAQHPLKHIRGIEGRLLGWTSFATDWLGRLGYIIFSRETGSEVICSLTGSLGLACVS